MPNALSLTFYLSRQNKVGNTSDMDEAMLSNNIRNYGTYLRRTQIMYNQMHCTTQSVRMVGVMALRCLLFIMYKLCVRGNNTSTSVPHQQITSLRLSLHSHVVIFPFGKRAISTLPNAFPLTLTINKIA